MKRKIAALAVGAMLFALSFPAEAGQQGKVHRLGYLANAVRGSPNEEAFRQGLSGLGYVEGQNVVIEYRWTEGNNELLPGFAAELVRLKVDIIVVAGGTPAVLAAKNATSAIPIVFVGSIDPVAVGLVASLAQPGGNITGLAIGAPGLYGKRLELIKETIPRLSSVGLLSNPSNAATATVFKETQIAAKDLGVQVQSLEVRSANDFDGAFETAIKAHVGALIVAQQPPINTNAKRIVELSAKSRLPAIYQDSAWPDGGGLMSYGPSIPDLYRRSAIYVDKILKGTKPANLPVEQPRKFELIINLNAAKQIGLTFPQSVLYRADRVIK